MRGMALIEQWFYTFPMTYPCLDAGLQDLGAGGHDREQGQIFTEECEGEELDEWLGEGIAATRRILCIVGLYEAAVMSKL